MSKDQFGVKKVDDEARKVMNRREEFSNYCKSIKAMSGGSATELPIGIINLSSS